MNGSHTLRTTISNDFSYGYTSQKRGSSGGGATASVALGSQLGSFTFAGWDGSAYGLGSNIQAITDEAFSTSAHGASLLFATTTPTTTSTTTRMKITGSGRILMGTITDNGVDGLQVNSTVNAAFGLKSPISAATPVFISTGTQSVSGCSLSSASGGASAGSFISGVSGTCSVTITPGGTAPHGWSCWASDLTTANLMRQTSVSSTQAIVAGTTVSGDSITWGCLSY